MSLAVETLGLSRRFGAHFAVRELDLAAPAGSVFGFLGANGAGKTTTLKMILGLLTPTSGRAMICGLDVAKQRLRATRQVGALLEAQGFYPELTAVQNLDLTRRLLNLPASDIDRVLDIVSMGYAAKSRVKGFSLGMRQRLGIARALLGSPGVLILDEPTNGLDPDGIIDMRQFLAALPSRANATVVVSSHLLSEVEQTATHLAIVEKGRLVMQGQIGDLLATVPAEVALDTDAPDSALLIAARLGFQPAEDSDGARLVYRHASESRAACGALSSALIEAGIKVFALAPKPPSLEVVYHRAITSARQSETA